MTLTVLPVGNGYPDDGYEGIVMAVSQWQLNRFERVLFSLALVLAGLLVIVRLGVMIVLPFLR